MLARAKSATWETADWGDVLCIPFRLPHISEKFGDSGSKNYTKKT